jgi:hypothetical protein
MDQATGAIPLPALPTRLPRNEEAASRTENNGDVFVEQPAPTRRLSVAGLHAAASRYVEPVPQVVQPPVEVQSRTSNRFINLNSQTFQPGRQLPHRQAQAQAQAATRPAGFTRGNPANVNPRFRNQARSAFQQSYSTFSGNNNFSRNPVAAGTGPFPPSPYAPIQGNQPRNFAHQQNRTMVPSMSYEYLASVTLPEFEKLGLPKVLTPPTTFTLLNGPASETFNYLTQHGKQRPPMDIAFQGRYEPFVQRALERRPLCAAILKIDELPYEVKNSDIVAYIGGTAKILNDNEEPIHIMMERITTKTGAAYVEFYDARSAYKVVEKHNNARTQGKPIRIQNRMVTASISSHDALMTDLFPCARGVTWRNGEPYVQSDNAFKGFVSEEELIGLVKNIEFPGRVSFNPLISHAASQNPNIHPGPLQPLLPSAQRRHHDLDDQEVPVALDPHDHPSPALEILPGHEGHDRDSCGHHGEPEVEVRDSQRRPGSSDSRPSQRQAHSSPHFCCDELSWLHRRHEGRDRLHRGHRPAQGPRLSPAVER